ncbi:ribosome biogenesis regulatory protein-domain-containing protein [Sporodiniella umbellata]|nr:ribosome biogenesis regulatory protein-domain-containing protein [Sporodiniella umbellata]
MDVTEILKKQEEVAKAIAVEKPVPLDFDLNLLVASDICPFDEKRLKTKSKTEDYLKELTRDNTQLLVNELFKLPVTSADIGVLATLPSRNTVIPREKPLPKDRPLTRWEKFAKTKGIQNKKRDKMVLNEETGEYEARWGYKRKDKDALAEDWLIPVPDHADPMEDQYEKAREAKKARVEKNTKRQRRNMEETTAATISGKKDIKELSKNELKMAIAASKKSTARNGYTNKK